jgi:hypothetical protein
MSRVLDSGTAAAFSAPTTRPLTLVMLTFLSGVQYVWSGVGPFTWNGMTFQGMGDLGNIEDIAESSSVQAEGTSVTLSGINNADLAESMEDSQPGLPAKVWYGGLDATGALVGDPVLQFSGYIDQPTITVGAEESTIRIALESRMNDHGRPNCRRYTSADQNANGYPVDSGFDGVEALNDKADVWGS